MKKYYTRACNFFYGKLSVKLVYQKKTIPLRGNKEISFNKIEILSRNSKKRIAVKDIKKLQLTNKNQRHLMSNCLTFTQQFSCLK